MVNDDFTGGSRAALERRMILSYAARTGREPLAALLALDDALGAILRSTHEPMLGQMRLTWWHDALTALDRAAPPAEPVLQALADHVVPGVSGGQLAAMIDGWEELLDADPLTDDRLQIYAQARGGTLFEAAGTLLCAAPDDPLDAAGRGWALADLAHHVGDPELARRAMALAMVWLEPAMSVRWSRRARPLGAMAHLARLDPGAGGRRVWRALRHRLTGR